MTRSGCVLSTASTFGRSASPISVTYLAESGQLSQWVRPTSRFPAPIAKIVSVVAGLSETMRFGTEAKLIVLLKSSRSDVAESVDVWRADLDADPSHARAR